MTRKRFIGLLRFWYYLQQEKAKEFGVNPVRLIRSDFSPIVNKNSSYLKVWTIIYDYTDDRIKKMLPLK